MTVLVVEPGVLPYEKEINGLAEMQAVVGGLIEPTYPYEDENVAFVGNDEALLLDMPFNRSIPGGYGGLFGNFFICGIEEDDFCSLTPEQIKRFKQEYRHAEILLGAKYNTPITLKVAAAPKIPPAKESHAEPER